MRDLQKDLETCNKATPGPWDVFPEVCGPEGQTVFQIDSGGDVCEVADPDPRGENRPTANMHLIAQAREGWPHAIKRAMKAEELNRELVKTLKDLLADTEDIILEYVPSSTPSGKSIDLIYPSINKSEELLERIEKEVE